MLKFMQVILVPLCSYLTHRQARQIGIAFVDSSKLQVCHNLRILKHQIGKGIMKLGKGTMGSYTTSNYTLLSMTTVGIISVRVMTANVDDSKPVAEMADEL